MRGVMLWGVVALAGAGCATARHVQQDRDGGVIAMSSNSSGHREKAMKLIADHVGTPGTIDCDYRGEVKVLLINHGADAFVVTPGMRIAQLVVAEVARVEWDQSEDLTQTARGAGGFGHTGQ